MNRRRFLGSATAVTAAWALGLPCAACAGLHYTQATLSRGRLLLPASALEPQGFALVEAPGFAWPIYIERRGDGSYSAVSTRCTHRGCQVEPLWGRLVCPCHGSEYAGDGKVLQGPTILPLKQFPVVVADRIIAVDISGGEL